MRQFLKKRKLCMQNLTKDREQPPKVILQQSIFYDIFIRCFWLRIIRRSDQGVWFMNFPLQLFLTILIMVTEQLYCRKVLCGCSRLTWLWLLIDLLKRCAERCALQLYRTSLGRYDIVPRTFTHFRNKLSLTSATKLQFLFDLVKRQ